MTRTKSKEQRTKNKALEPRTGTRRVNREPHRHLYGGPSVAAHVETTDHRPPTTGQIGRRSSVVGRRSSILWLLALGIALYIVVFTVAAWYKYASYQMGFDLGVHEQVLWNTAHGRIAATSAFAETDSYLGIDIIPTELLLAPLYALVPSAYTMLFVQTLALALGAVPVFLLVRDRFATLQGQAEHGSQSAICNLQSAIPGWAGLAFAAAFLLYLPVEYMNLYEFQIRAFATTFLLMALYALERRRFWPFLLWSLLALGCRSDVGLVLAGMGAYASYELRVMSDEFSVANETIGNSKLKTQNSKLSQRNSKLKRPEGTRNSKLILFGLLPILLGLGWFALCLGVLIPFFRGGAPSLYLSVIYGQIDGRPWLGDSPGEIIRTVLTRPGFVLQEVFGSAVRGPMRLRYLLEMFLPFGFLLLLQPRMLLITLPIFALNLLSNTPNIHASTHYHYQALIIPFMVVGSAYGLEWLIRRTTDHRPPTTEDPRLETRDPRTGIRRVNQEQGNVTPSPLHPFTPSSCHLVTLSLIGVLALALLCNLIIFAPRPFNSRNPAVSLLGSALKESDDRAHVRVIEQLLAQVPPDAPLATTNNIGPHAARRERIFFFPGNVIYPEAKVAQAEFLLIDQVELLQDARTRAERQRLLADLAASRRYRRLAEEQGVSLWRRVIP
ncbi:MAG: DUF2079 domain-containing protein [Roseiflexaceae bacterium]